MRCNKGKWHDIFNTVTPDDCAPNNSEDFENSNRWHVNRDWRTAKVLANYSSVPINPIRHDSQNFLANFSVSTTKCRANRNFMRRVTQKINRWKIFSSKYFAIKIKFVNYIFSIDRLLWNLRFCYNEKFLDKFQVEFLVTSLWTMILKFLFYY